MDAVTEDRDEIVQVYVHTDTRYGVRVPRTREYSVTHIPPSVSLSDFATAAAAGPTGPANPTRGFPAVAD